MVKWIEEKYKNNLGYIPDMSLDGSVEWSMEKIFGKMPPYNVKTFRRLCPRTKLFGTCIEGKDFCTSCGTTTPSVPRSHHSTCEHYGELDEYPEIEPFLWGCPDCKEDSLIIDSSVELGVSEISCTECEYLLQHECCEEELIAIFKKREEA